MPVYEYQCKACGREFEYQQRMSDPEKTLCEACGEEKLERIISRTAFQLKGGGWYKDLYASTKPEGGGGGGDKKADAPAAAADKPAAKPESGGGTSGGDSGSSSGGTSAGGTSSGGSSSGTSGTSAASTTPTKSVT
jgi:putative FmdB family regulatory protein